MPRQGLSRTDIVCAAIELVESKGLQAFSVRELAEKLHIKAASLYNHIKNMDELYTEIGYYAISELKKVQIAAIEGKQRDQAVSALADAYYQFGKRRPEIYKVILSLPMVKNDVLLTAAGDIVEPIMTAMSGYNLSDEQKMHLQRVLRSIMHGFLSQEEAGCFRHFPVSLTDSYQIAIRGFILLLTNSENEVKL